MLNKFVGTELPIPTFPVAIIAVGPVDIIAFVVVAVLLVAVVVVLVEVEIVVVLANAGTAQTLGIGELVTFQDPNFDNGQVISRKINLPSRVFCRIRFIFF